MTDKPELKILTIGHSTRTLAEFIELLKANAVVEVVDIRTVPRSRYNPQFNKDTLPIALAHENIKYRHLPGLGGLRKPRSDSRNIAWQNKTFRGFADYMQTTEFISNLNRLIQAAALNQVVLMCAEAVPWRCHRSLIADALLVRHIQVDHIIDEDNRISHKLTPWAKVDGIHVSYPARA